ncbi:hypothetical protein J7384_17010 [Endozoicomonas sp. G2_1]|uniref:hypothetical protein n=1 Tax=Endozoicomonas sp. G2_1 TaxID=2821091 RepID=UPI001ADBFC5C|nr:hypothetical protein [Endozoicomonas sp. G2_1]MBO9492064.1 hypothetical protein [Endozoicomonas sp. G2_1]
MGGGGGSNRLEETEEQRASARVAMQRWNDYQTLFRPYETEYFGRVERLGSETAMNDVRRLATNSVTSQFNGGINQAASSMAASNINPNSGLFQQEIGRLEQQKAKARADSVNRSQIAQQDRFVSGLQSIAQMGQGQAVDSIAGLGDVARSANNYANSSASNALQRSTGRNQVLGSAIGAGLNYSLNNDDGGN